jgi:hypothetical protein
MMSTVRAAKTVLAVSGLLIAVVAGCSHSPQRGATTAHRPTTSDIYGSPSDAAIAALARATVPTAGRDCGHVALDSGWPTTTIMSDKSVCLRDADRMGRAAFMIATGRDYDHSAYRIVLTTTGDHRLLVTVIDASPTGAVRRYGWRCGVPAEPIAMSVFFPNGRPEPALVDNGHCTSTST